MIEEYREDYDLPEDATDREVIETYLDYQNCRIGYPYDLDPAMQEENEVPDEDKIETIVWRPMFGVPGLEYIIGKRLKQELYDDRVQNNSFHICLLKTAGDPVIAYFGLDRKIINLSGGGTYITKEKDGKTVRELPIWKVFRSRSRKMMSRNTCCLSLKNTLMTNWKPIKTESKTAGLMMTEKSIYHELRDLNGT